MNQIPTFQIHSRKESQPKQAEPIRFDEIETRFDKGFFRNVLDTTRGTYHQTIAGFHSGRALFAHMRGAPEPKVTQLLERAGERKEIAQNLAPSVQRVEEIRGLKDVASFAMTTTLQVTPVIAQIIGGAVAGGYFGAKGGALTGVVAGPAGAAVGAKVGGAGGSVVGGFSVAYGLYAGDLFESTVAMGAQRSEAQSAALKYAIPAAGVSIIAPTYISGHILKHWGKEAVKSRIKESLKIAAVSIPVEGTAEAVAENFVMQGELAAVPGHYISPEERASRTLNAGIAGGLGIGIFAGGTAMIKPRTIATEQQIDAEIDRQMEIMSETLNHRRNQPLELDLINKYEQAINLTPEQQGVLNYFRNLQKLPTLDQSMDLSQYDQVTVDVLNRTDVENLSRTKQLVNKKQRTYQENLELSSLTIHKPQITTDVFKGMDTSQVFPESVQHKISLPAAKEVAEPTISMGRLRHLDNSIKEIDTKIDALSREITLRQSQGLTSLPLTSQIESLQQKREILDSERATIVSPDETPRLKGMVALTASEVVKSVNTAIIKTSTQTRKGIKERLMRINEIIRNSNLTPEQKAKFVFSQAQMAGIKSEKAFNKATQRIIDRVNRIKETTERKTAFKKAIKVIKKTKPTKEFGKKVSKFGPEVQSLMDSLREKVNLKTSDAEAEFYKKMEGIFMREATTGEATSPQELLEMQVLAIRIKSDTITTEDVNQFVEDITQFIEDGRTERDRTLFNDFVEVERKTETVVERVLGEEKLGGIFSFGRDKQQLSQLKKARRRIGVFFKEFGKSTLANWGGLMTISEFQTPVGTEVLPKLFNVNNAENKLQELDRDFNADFYSAVMDSYNIEKSKYSWMDTKRANDQLATLTKEEINFGEFTDADGVKGELVMTRDEAIKRWMELLDPTLEASFLEGNRMTEEMLNAIRTRLSEQDITFAEHQLRIYRKTYDGVNEVYKRMFGMNLTFNEFYSPIRRGGLDVDMESSFGEFLQEQVWRNQNIPGAVKARVDSKRPIELQSSVNVLMRHHRQMHQFIAYGEFVREAQRVFSKAEVREAYKKSFSEGLYLNILRQLDFIAGKSSEAANPLSNAVRWLRTRFTFGQLALKPQIGGKQTISLFAYLEVLGDITGGMGAKALMAGTYDFFKNPSVNLKILQNEVIAIAERGRALERDVSAITNTKEFKSFMVNPSYINWAMLNVRMGDLAPIVLGAWSMRKAMLARGDSMDKIVFEISDFTKNTQQSALPGRLTLVQQMSEFSRLLTMFLSAPIRYQWKEVNAIRTMFREGGTSKQNLQRVARAIVIYRVILPQLFQAASTLVVPNDERWRDEALLALMLGPMNSIAIAGRILENVIRGALGMRVFTAEVPIVSIYQDLNRFIRAIKAEDITMEEIEDAIRGLAGAGTSFGLPTEQTYNFVGGIIDLFKGNVGQGITRIMGYGKWTAEQAFPKDEKPSGEMIRFQQPRR